MEDAYYIYKLNDVMDLPDVFCNGDLHAQNMFWIKDKDGKASDELLALHDWQVGEHIMLNSDFESFLLKLDSRFFTSGTS